MYTLNNIFGGFLRKIVGGGIENPLKTLAVVFVLLILPISSWAVVGYDCYLITDKTECTGKCTWSDANRCEPVCEDANKKGCYYNKSVGEPLACGEGDYCPTGVSDPTECKNSYNGKPGYKSASLLVFDKSYNFGSAEWAAVGVTKENCPWKITCGPGETIAETATGCEKCDLGFYAQDSDEMTYWYSAFDDRNIRSSRCKECDTQHGEGTSNKDRTDCNNIVIRKKSNAMGGDPYDEKYIKLGTQFALPDAWFSRLSISDDKVLPGYCLGMDLYTSESETLPADTAYKQINIDTEKHRFRPILYAKITLNAKCPKGYYCPGSTIDENGTVIKDKENYDPKKCPNGMTTDVSDENKLNTSIENCIITKDTKFCDRHGCFTLPKLQENLTSIDVQTE